MSKVQTQQERARVFCVIWGLIMLLARWASAVTLAYLKEAPLEILTDKYRKSVGTSATTAASSASSSSTAANAHIKNNDKALKRLKATVKKFDDKVMLDLAMLREECTKLRADQELLFQRLCRARACIFWLKDLLHERQHCLYLRRVRARRHRGGLCEIAVSCQIVRHNHV